MNLLQAAGDQKIPAYPHLARSYSIMQQQQSPELQQQLSSNTGDAVDEAIQSQSKEVHNEIFVDTSVFDALNERHLAKRQCSEEASLDAALTVDASHQMPPMSMHLSGCSYAVEDAPPVDILEPSALTPSPQAPIFQLMDGAGVITGNQTSFQYQYSQSSEVGDPQFDSWVKPVTTHHSSVDY